MAGLVLALLLSMAALVELAARRGPRARPFGAARPTRAQRLASWMAVAICSVAVLAYWDAERESRAALDDFAREQALLAKTMSAGLRSELAHASTSAADAASPRFASLFSAAGSLERRGELRVLLHDPARAGLLAPNGARLRSAPIEAALAGNDASLRLSREEAEALGLPKRTAMAGLARLDAGARGEWGIAVVASARNERDREIRAEWRLVLAVVLASGLVLAFGGIALRKQRKELELSRELAIAEVQHARDERLVRADKLATLGALATGIAHEVSTPLGVILGRAEQLQPKLAGDERARRAIEVIAEQTNRISHVIRGFLNLARGNSPRFELTPPAMLAEKALELVEHRFQKAGVELNSSIAQGLPAVPCEPRLFEQVLVNLLLNACDACAPGGHVELQLSARAERVVFAVVDDGQGITPEAVQRATEPFFTTKPLGQGSGLGLAIASEIVKHHQGTLEIAPRARASEAECAQTEVKVGTRAVVEVSSRELSHHAEGNASLQACARARAGARRGR